MQRIHHHRLEMVPVLRQQTELESLGQNARRDGFAHGLKAPDQQPAGIVPDVEMIVMVREGRRVPLNPIDRFGQEIEMLAGQQWHLGLCHGTDITGPQAGTQRDGIAHHRTLVRLNAFDAAVLGQNAGNACTFEEFRTR